MTDPNDERMNRLVQGLTELAERIANEGQPGWGWEHDDLNDTIALLNAFPAMREEMEKVKGENAEYRATNEKYWQMLQEQGAELAALRSEAEEARKMVNSQAEDESLWFIAEHPTEERLQKALRYLHEIIERPLRQRKEKGNA